MSPTTLLSPKTILSVIPSQHGAVGNFQRRFSKYPALQWLILLLGPCDVTGDQRHDRDAETANQKLRQQRSRTCHQHKTAGEREEDADAEHRKRLLATDDERLEHRPLQSAPVLGQKPCHEKRDDDEMQQAIRREIFLVIRIE